MSFQKLKKGPFGYNLLRHLSSIFDGLTGIIMLPFGRYGTLFYLDIVTKILLWQAQKAKEQAQKAKEKRNTLLTK